MTRAERFPALTLWERLSVPAQEMAMGWPLWRAACWEKSAENAILDGYPRIAIECKREADQILWEALQDAILDAEDEADAAS